MCSASAHSSQTNLGSCLARGRRLVLPLALSCTWPVPSAVSLAQKPASQTQPYRPTPAMQLQRRDRGREWKNSHTQAASTNAHSLLAAKGFLQTSENPIGTLLSPGLAGRDCACTICNVVSLYYAPTVLHFWYVLIMWALGPGRPWSHSKGGKLNPILVELLVYLCSCTQIDCAICLKHAKQFPTVVCC